MLNYYVWIQLRNCAITLSEKLYWNVLYCMVVQCISVKKCWTIMYWSHGIIIVYDYRRICVWLVFVYVYKFIEVLNFVQLNCIDMDLVSVLTFVRLIPSSEREMHCWKVFPGKGNCSNAVILNSSVMCIDL